MSAPHRNVPLTGTPLGDADVDAVLEAYRSGWLTMGPRTERFEEAFAAATGAAHAVAVSSGTAAVHLALLAAGVGAGDEVIVPALTFGAVEDVVRACGATPVRCDIAGAHDHNADPADVADRVTPATRAILATHRWGYPCDMPALRATCDRHGLVLVEDAAQAILAGGVGAGDLTCYSLSGTKQLGVGEGGMVTAPAAAHAARVRSLRSHAMTSVTWDRHRGHAQSYDVVDVGFNYRLDEPRAALGLSRLGALAAEIRQRRAVVRAYRAAFADLQDAVVVPFTDGDVERSSHCCFGLVFASGGTRDAVCRDLGRHGIQTLREPDIAVGDRGTPRAGDVASRSARLPLSGSLDEGQVAAVVDAVRAALRR
ncbi:MAG: DegT/DnrJ/EryC1/StrS family aminotransferase [Solirubrobacterales bacterium]|nr:DegT/DnrJ/EryC1/StrS family aminotransferase [Solirubrobacterales bacterium]